MGHCTSFDQCSEHFASNKHYIEGFSLRPQKDPLENDPEESWSCKQRRKSWKKSTARTARIHIQKKLGNSSGIN